MRRLLAALATGFVLVGCGGEDAPHEDAPSTEEPAAAASVPAGVRDLFRRYDRLLDRADFDHEQAFVRKLAPGDRALYVLWSVDGEINNGGFSQYLFNSTAELHDEAVESAKLVRAPKTAALLRRLPETLGVRAVPESRGARQDLVDRLTAEQEEALGRMDEEWFDDISVEIQARLVAYVRKHPEAFSAP